MGWLGRRYTSPLTKRLRLAEPAHYHRRFSLAVSAPGHSVSHPLSVRMPVLPAMSNFVRGGSGFLRTFSTAPSVNQPATRLGGGHIQVCGKCCAFTIPERWLASTRNGRPGQNHSCKSSPLVGAGSGFSTHRLSATFTEYYDQSRNTREEKKLAQELGQLIN